MKTNRDAKFENALKNQKPILVWDYDKVLEILLKTAGINGYIDENNIIRINPANGNFEIYASNERTEKKLKHIPTEIKCIADDN